MVLVFKLSLEFFNLFDLVLIVGIFGVLIYIIVNINF